MWVKNHWTGGDLVTSFGRQYEVCYLVNKGNCPIKGKRYSDVWVFPRISHNSQLHSNQKPIDLVSQMIESHSSEDDLIFDGFGGSGTSGVAAKLLKRNFIICELDEMYYNIANSRLKKYKSKEDTESYDYFEEIEL
jgi:site-specific DNA-methyltransferase (adenine-specific)